MPAELVLCEPPSALYRVERISPVLSFSRINAVDAALDTAGNRFDVPGAGVLYGATSATGAFAETLAVFRPSSSLAAKLAAAGGADALTSHVPASWRTARRLRRFTTINSLPFVDIEHPATHTYLTERAHALLEPRNVDALDVALVRGPSRLLTRGLSSWLYAQTDAHGAPQYGGVRYVSRLGDFECWAAFDGTAVSLDKEQSIELEHPELIEVAGLFDLRMA